MELLMELKAINYSIHKLHLRRLTGLQGAPAYVHQGHKIIFDSSTLSISLVKSNTNSSLDMIQLIETAIR